MHTPFSRFRSEEYSEYMRGNGPVPIGIVPHRNERSATMDYWGDPAEYRIDDQEAPKVLEADILNGVAQEHHQRIIDIARHYMRTGNGGWKPRVVRSLQNERYNVAVPWHDALRFAVLDHQLETRQVLEGPDALAYGALRERYRELFFYRHRPEDIDLPSMQE